MSEDLKIWGDEYIVMWGHNLPPNTGWDLPKSGRAYAPPPPRFPTSLSSWGAAEGTFKTHKKFPWVPHYLMEQYWIDINSEGAFLLLKFRFSEKSTEIWKNIPLVLKLLSKRQNKFKIFFFKFVSLFYNILTLGTCIKIILQK